MGIKSFLGLKGSWKWAKKQMLKGKVVRSKSWRGALKLRIDNPENKLLQMTHWESFQEPPHGKLWETAAHFLNEEDLTDYEIVE